MPVLELLSVAAHWDPNAETKGHASRRPVTLTAESGQWVALLGFNGLGKSTLLHAIAGTAPHVAGRIAVDGHWLRPREVDSRFWLGVQHVRQDACFPALLSRPAPLADAIELAYRQRLGLFNEEALADLLPRLNEFGWVKDGQVSGRIFDLVAAVLALPRVLLLDEVVGAFPPGQRSEQVYQRLRELLPRATVIFTDHSLERARAVADKLLILREGELPLSLDKSEVNEETVRRLASATFRSVAEEDFADADKYLGSLRLSREVRHEVELSLRVGHKSKKDRAQILSRLTQNFPFLARRAPVGDLSGGQRIVLLWVLLEVSRANMLPNFFLDHLDPANRERLVSMRQSLQEQRNG